jgi:hypothetical protein
MARRLGFDSVAAFEAWEEEIVLDHFANFICDYLALGYTVEPDRRGLVAYIDLDSAVEERIRMLEERRFEMVLDPDKSECKSPVNCCITCLRFKCGWRGGRLTAGV